MIGIEDKEFLRGKVPMTKEEIRVISLSKLRLKKNFVALDIGSGTGSVSIEMAKFLEDGLVYSLEKKEEAYSLFLKNIEKFKIYNCKASLGEAPKDLPKNIKFDAIFIGGSGGNIEEIIDYSYLNLNETGRIVLNFITIENTYKTLDKLNKSNFKEVDIISVNIARGRKVGGLTLMESNNPIYIISATR
ncbi:precorrin-6Y C5,15-methyltransferase (decarboxylating) subunit CbiT [Helicovermis profundi]|uniref:Precorrin-6Y C5,15-methyltransferase (Decarboxylating) subunit CbiT n=1 Tax=Helicovermis profundi TaxID=3065157 RepID=A0AAU9EJE3_9FIRM|nr:precorrin-6Y C5,15-methyltransferase (decarboxylating) subunit CbiT [Clostridia bacterium S502]